MSKTINTATEPNDSLTCTVNGNPLPLTSTLSIAELIKLLGFTGKRIAVERNGEIVPKSQHAATALVSGDQLEIVVAVGGG